MSHLIKTCTRYGHTMEVDPEEHISKSIIQNGVYDKDTLSLIIKLIKIYEVENILDIGANVGNHSLPFSLYARRVWSFEPSPDNFEKLCNNININKITKIEAINLGISNKNQKAVFYYNTSKNSGASTLRKNSKLEGHTYQKQSVQLVNGDEYMQQHINSKIDLIKIDVEGHENEVLEGLEVTINDHKPLIIMEWKDASTDKKGLLDSKVLKEISDHYSFFLTVQNTDKKGWKRRTLGQLRRQIKKLKPGKQLSLMPFDPYTEATEITTKDIVLIPKLMTAPLKKKHLIF